MTLDKFLNKFGTCISDRFLKPYSADKIEYKKSPQEDGISYTAFGNVVIKDSSKIARCEIATYLIDNEMTILSVNPSIEDSEQILTGEKIILTYHQHMASKPNDDNA